MRCCCRGRFLLLALLLLPAGLGHGAGPLPPSASRPPASAQGSPAGRDAPSEEIPVGRDALFEGIPAGRNTPSEEIAAGRDALSEEIPVERDVPLGLPPSAAASVTQTPAGAAGWESSSTVPTAVVTSTGLSSASSASWEPSSPRSTVGSQVAVPTATPMGHAVHEPAPARSAPTTTWPQASALAPLSPTIASSSASPPASSASQRPPSGPTAVPGPPLPEGTAGKSGPGTGVTVQEVPRALSSGSIVAITLTVIVTVVLVFGAAAYLKMRHSSYGRLRDSHDYGSWGSYNNPLYDDS